MLSHISFLINLYIITLIYKINNILTRFIRNNAQNQGVFIGSCYFTAMLRAYFGKESKEETT